MPCSEVNRPSVILEPVSRGFLISGFEIFILFVGLSMVFDQKASMYAVGMRDEVGCTVDDAGL